MNTVDMPFGVAVLSVLLVLGAIIGIFIGSLLFLGGVAFPPLVIYALVVLLISLAYFYLAYGLWNGREWARKFTIYLQIIGVTIGWIIILVVVAMISMISPWGWEYVGWEYVSPMLFPSIIQMILVTIFAVIIVYYLTRPHVKAFFGSPYAVASQQIEIPESLKMGVEALKQKSLELTGRLKDTKGEDMIRGLRESKEEKEKIDYYLENLQSMYERNEISEDNYRELKREYESKLKIIEKRITELILEIERRKEQYRKEKERLEFERNTTMKLLDNLENRYIAGEIDEETYRRRKSEAEKNIKNLERRIRDNDEIIKKLESV